MYSHTPVLLKEVLEYLQPQADSNYVDATLGGGGYTDALLQVSSPAGKVLAIDLDPAALENAKAKFQQSGDRLVLAHGNFRDFDKIITHHEFANIDGIVADIGLSSYQLDGSERGISFQNKELLDMRFDTSSNQPDARFLLHHRTAEELAKIFTDYGEEKYSYKIAQNIVRVVEEAPSEGRNSNEAVKYTTDLVKIIQDSLPKPEKHRWADSARRIFQALRIEVNGELANLEAFLPKAFNLLDPGGRLAIVSFHSLEDRIVKNYFKELATGCICPPGFPICKCGRTPQAKILTKKAVTAGDAELENNSRAKPAKLRVIQKL
ncbi:16S rRNA (cytosine(1402)-N(4))-methyltransferase RsmH [bacterium]|nr:MAG: 16S rRNA (cytosine(1402)-N(4))-methyltransferase RsmH [bacterium]